MKATEPRSVTNVVVAGLGGQGVLKASDILAEAAFLAGLDVKKAEVHGMSQRGGSVTSDVRFGTHVHSPMVPYGEADFLLVLAEEEVENNRPALRPGGRLIEPSRLRGVNLPNPRTLNIALLGVLSRYLPFSAATWQQTLAHNLPEKLQAMNSLAFALGQQVAASEPDPA